MGSRETLYQLVLHGKIVGEETNMAKKIVANLRSIQHFKARRSQLEEELVRVYAYFSHLNSQQYTRDQRNAVRRALRSIRKDINTVEHVIELINADVTVQQRQHHRGQHGLVTKDEGDLHEPRLMW